MLRARTSSYMPAEAKGDMVWCNLCHTVGSQRSRLPADWVGDCTHGVPTDGTGDTARFVRQYRPTGGPGSRVGRRRFR